MSVIHVKIFFILKYYWDNTRGFICLRTLINDGRLSPSLYFPQTINV